MSPKRRRLEAMDAHQSQTDGESRPPSEQHNKAVLPVIQVNEETDSPPTALVNSAPAESGELSDKSSSASDAVDSITGPHVRSDANCYPENDNKTSPVDSKLSSEDFWRVFGSMYLL